MAKYSKKSILDELGNPSKSFGFGPFDSDLYGHKASKGYKQCFETHPPLKLPGTDLVVYGGSCSRPVIQDADIYIGFDRSMTFTKRALPWHEGSEFLFHIPDMQAPVDPTEFAKLVSWARAAITVGAKLHCGCIGGHGRTGTFLAALVSTFGEKDAIAYVREHYCKKAVESAVQVKFLADHFGIKPVAGAKSYSSKSTKSTKLGLGGSTSGVKYLDPLRGTPLSIWSRQCN